MQELSSQTENEESNENFSLEKVLEISDLLANRLDLAIGEVNTVNKKMSILSVNASIESAHAGDAGKAFTIVSSYMRDLSLETTEITKKMKTDAKNEIEHLSKIIKSQIEKFRGTRLSYLALTNIDLIDRNLYERTADIRWWSTDSSLVEALTKRTPESSKFASRRLGIILNAYTVYHDLILCDLDGIVIASGKSGVYDLIGKDCSKKLWFQNAKNTMNGESFGFQTVHKSKIKDQYPMTFSCKVHKEGNTNNSAIGILASVFNWNGLAQEIMYSTPLDEKEKTQTRVCIVDDDGLVLADSDDHTLEDTIQFDQREKLFSEKMNYIFTNYKGEECCIVHALSPGYEKYSSGFHSIIIQKLKSNDKISK